jgi:hypothetical protein
MRDDRLVVSERTGNNGRCHPFAAKFGRQGSVMYGGIGVLDETRQQAD